MINKLLMTQVAKQYLLCEVVSHGVHDEKNDSAFVLFRFKTWFELSGFLNSQNNRFPLLIHEVPLHDVAVGVWCAISATTITGWIHFLL
jgi:hypothetical protein